MVPMPTLSSDEDSEDEGSEGYLDSRGQRSLFAHAGGSGGQHRRLEISEHKAESEPRQFDETSVSEGRTGVGNNATTTPLSEGQEIFYTTTDFYIALRMHHLLAERLSAGKRLCEEARLSSQTAASSVQEVRVLRYR